MPPNTNTTYTTGTIAQLDAGTDATGRLQTAKLLNDWLNPKLDNKFDKTGGVIDGSLDIKQSTSAIPALGARNSSLYVTANSLYGMQFGIIGSGVGFIQQGRTDGSATSYSLSLQPSGGNVLINNQVAYHAGNIPT